jgi:hypothetical protein
MKINTKINKCKYKNNINIIHFNKIKEINNKIICKHKKMTIMYMKYINNSNIMMQNYKNKK